LYSIVVSGLVFGVWGWVKELRVLFMATIKKFEDLEIWQLARQLENKIFEETEKGKLSKDYKLKDQMNASSGSIMDNIAEGFGRAGRLEFVQFLSISNGSGNELQSQLYRCLDRKYISQSTFDELYILTDLVCRKINAFMSYLNKSSVKGQKFANRKIIK
jgi:four helix bundle protein